MQFDWSHLNQAGKDVYRLLCPINEYRVIHLDEAATLPGISPGLLKNCSTTLFIAASGDANGRVYYLANLHRPDPRDRKGAAIDQMPFGFIFDNNVELLSGALIQHGEWDGRSTYPAPSAWQNLVDGNIKTYAELQIVPDQDSGSIFDLNCHTQLGAFSTIIGKLSSQASKFILQSETDNFTDSTQ